MLHSAPATLDTDVCAQILTHTGAQVALVWDKFMVATAATVRSETHLELGRRVRTTDVLAAAALARCGG
ncbi:hypothetical protein [Streptomyces collinus]